MDPDFTPELIIRAYCMGIFPMGDEEGGIRWYSPDPRCIIDLNEFHASDRLTRTYRKGRYEVCIDTAWERVIRECAERETTWITDDVIEAYTQLHQMGIAHSVEAYAGGQLAGGLYGVSLGGAFMGESMFHRATDASKVCLVFLVERLRERGYVLLDCQYMTEHLRRFGAKLIPRDEYLRRLSHALSLSCRLN